MQACKHISPYCINEEPVDRLPSTGWPVHSTGRHWSFLDAPPKMTSGYQQQNNLRPVDALSRPVETAKFFSKCKMASCYRQQTKLLPVDALPQPVETAQVLREKKIQQADHIRRHYSRLDQGRRIHTFYKEPILNITFLMHYSSMLLMEIVITFLLPSKTRDYRLNI